MKKSLASFAAVLALSFGAAALSPAFAGTVKCAAINPSLTGLCAPVPLDDGYTVAKGKGKKTPPPMFAKGKKKAFPTA